MEGRGGLQNQQWKVESIYSNVQEWEKDFTKFNGEDQKKLLSLSGKLHEGVDQLCKALSLYFSLDRLLNKIYTYAHLRYDEDLTNDEHKTIYGQSLLLSNEFEYKFSWIESEILKLSTEVLEKYLKDEKTAPYRVYLKRLLHLKPHRLEKEQEELLTLCEQPLMGAQKAFSAFNNADLKFHSIKDEKGEEKPLTSSSYLRYMREGDRTLRKNAFETLHQGYLNNENLLCELLFTQVQKHLFFAKARKYKSCLQAALYPHNIDPSVYTLLIQSVRSKINVLHRYGHLRKKWLKIEKLFPYDLSIPILKSAKVDMDYKKGCQNVIASVEPLGKEYQKTLEEGLLKKGWVDPFENKGKRSGAYSSGCYDTEPFILMNYYNTLNDVFTLAHEAGHSMHSYLSNHHQSYQDSKYPIFVAEVASTFNELLLLKHLYAQSKDPLEKASLLLYQIDGIRSTFFRQVQFAEYELLVHQAVEENQPLTPTFLKQEYAKLNKIYYGDALENHPLIEVEWARIPHFYYNFYVYQYATGISAAYSLFDNVQKNKEAAEKYLKFLSSGCTHYPIELLKIAGVDMHSTSSIEGIITRFGELITELDHLMEKKNKLH